MSKSSLLYQIGMILITFERLPLYSKVFFFPFTYALLMLSSSRVCVVNKSFTQVDDIYVGFYISLKEQINTRGYTKKRCQTLHEGNDPKPSQTTASRPKVSFPVKFFRDVFRLPPERKFKNWLSSLQVILVFEAQDFH